MIFSLEKQNGLLFKIASLVLILAFIFSPIAPFKKAEAQYVVTCPNCEALLTAEVGISEVISSISSAIIGYNLSSLQVKEYVLDPIVKMVARTILQSMTRSIVNWISNGFEGSPSFIQDPKKFFANVADEAIGRIINSNEATRWMCSPFRLQLKRALIYNRSFTQRAQCTLTNIVRNYEGFINGVNNELGTLGGWNAWNVMATQPENNPYGAYALFNLQVSAAISADTQREANLLNWGSGFMSWRDPSCVASARAAQSAEMDNELDPDGRLGRANYGLTEDASGNVSQITPNLDPNNCDVNTPGSVIAGTINKTLGAGQDELIAADEINEIFSALMYQLASQVLGGGGLFEAGGGGSSSGSNYARQVEEEDRAMFQNSKNDAAGRVTTSVEDENNFIAVENQIIARIEISAQRYRDIVVCYQGKLATSTSSTTGGIELTNTERQTALNEISSASTTVAQILLLRTPHRRNVAIGESNLTTLNSLINRINNLSYEQRSNLPNLMTEYSNLMSQVHNRGDVIQAEFERDYTIPDNLEDFDTQSAQKFGQCQQFPVRNVDSGGI